MTVGLHLFRRGLALILIGTGLSDGFPAGGVDAHEVLYSESL